MGNLLCQAMFLFLCGEPSRNSMNNRREHGPLFESNFSLFFEDMKLAHFDTVDDTLREISMEEVEKVKVKMIQSLIEKKRISTFYGRYLIAIDATGITTYDEDQKEHLIYRTSKCGKKTYLNMMLEAKIVTPEGLCLSIASEPLSNNEIEAYQKQDCELKAFKRITAKIKKFFPRLPVCLLLDALYTNNTVFDFCEQYGWKYIASLKDGCLPLLQESVIDTAASCRIKFERPVVIKNKTDVKYGTTSYQCIEGLHHKGHTVNWVECICRPTTEKDGSKTTDPVRFVYLTNLYLTGEASQKMQTIMKIAQAGRLRWKIENEGFNTQKNHGYHLHHKFSRWSPATLHVYYILLQIAHIINQLVVHSKGIVMLMTRYPKLSVRYLWERLRGQLETQMLSRERISQNNNRCQIRLE